MQEFKIGDKVLVEARIIDIDNSDMPYKVAVFDRLERQLWTDKVYPIPTKTYEDGLNDAWEACRKIFCDKENGGLSASALKEIFRETFDVQDVIEKIKAWEDERELHIAGLVAEIEGDSDA